MKRGGQGVLLCLAGLGCEPDYPVEYETQHLRVAKTFDAPICAGTLRAMDLDAARISQAVGGSETPPQIDLILGDDAVSDHCPASSAGCAFPGGPVYTNLGSTGHELVHALAVGVPRNAFIEEGLAEAIGGGFLNTHKIEVEDGGGSLTDALMSDEPDYAVAGHFVAWLIDTQGLPRFLEFRAALGGSVVAAEIAASFEATYGVSLTAAEMMWTATAPSTYQLGQGECGGPSEPWMTAERWQGQLVTDCDEEHTLGPVKNSMQASMSRTLLADVTRPGGYTMTITTSRAGRVRLDPTTCGCWSGFEIPTNYDLPAGEWSTTVGLSACRYRVSFVVIGVEPATAEVEFEWLEGRP